MKGRTKTTSRKKATTKKGATAAIKSGAWAGDINQFKVLSPKVRQNFVATCERLQQDPGKALNHLVSGFNKSIGM